MEYRPLTEEHVPRLAKIKADYESNKYLRLTKIGGGLEVGFTLRVERLEEPFRSRGYGLIREKDRAEIRSRMDAQALQLVVEDNGRLVGLLDAEMESWRNVLKVWDILVDEEHRLQGIGTELMSRAYEFAAKKNCRALVVETQTTNWPALNFYLKMGFHVHGVDDHFYTNRDLKRKELAVFLYREQ